MRTIKTIRTERAYKSALLIREINARFTSLVAERIAGTGLTFPQIMLVKALAHSKEPTITELAKELSTGKSTVVGIVDRLEREGLVVRLRGGPDRREVRVAFAPEARERMLGIRAVVDATFAKAFDHLDEGELEALERSLANILAAMGAPAKADGPEGKGAPERGPEGD